MRAACLVGPGVPNTKHRAANVGNVTVDQHSERLTGTDAEDGIGLPVPQDPGCRSGSQVLASPAKGKLIDHAGGKKLGHVERGRTLIRRRVVIVLNAGASPSRPVLRSQEPTGAIVGGP